MFISVIIPTYNRVEVLKKCLDGITNQNISKDEFEILIIDDCSQDDTQEFCEYYSAEMFNVFYIRNKTNQGRVITRNEGIKRSSGSLLVFLDNDLVVQPDFLQCHLNYYNDNQHYKIAVVSDVTYQPEVLANTNFGTFIQSRAIGYRSSKDMIGINLRDLPSNYFAGGGSSCKKEDALHIGMFDENLKKYGSEDELFGFKLREIGVKIMFCPEAKVIHHDRNILPQYWKTKFIEQGRYGLRTIMEQQAEMIDHSMFKFLMPINSRTDDWKTMIIKKVLSIASADIIRKPVEKYVFATDKNKILNFPILYRYIAMAWVNQGFKFDENIEEVSY